MDKTNCENCMWGDNCPVLEKCDCYDPIDEDYIDDPIDTRRLFDEDWQRYMRNRYNDLKAADVFKLFY